MSCNVSHSEDNDENQNYSMNIDECSDDIWTWTPTRWLFQFVSPSVPRPPQVEMIDTTSLLSIFQMNRGNNDFSLARFTMNSAWFSSYCSVFGFVSLSFLLETSRGPWWNQQCRRGPRVHLSSAQLTQTKWRPAHRNKTKMVKSSKTEIESWPP